MAKTLKDIIPAFKKSPYGDYTIDVHSPDKEKVDTVTPKADNHKDKKLTKEEALEMIENYDQLDELSRERLSRYISRTEDDPKRKTGRNLALKKMWGDKKYGTKEAKVKASEEVELDQLDEGYAEQQVDYLRRAITQAQTIGQYLERLAEMAQASAEHQAGVQDGSIDPKQVVAPRSPYFEAKYFSRQLEDMADSLENSIDQMDGKY